ncbi:MAG: polysaccharide deacetylase family protein, partial [Chloroflexota bacterium]|nr:polysaccharide deacetylase family protein [Chloroflexota bacterium]
LAPIISRAPRILPEVAVSIDDGWDPYWVGQALDILDAFDLKATLFPTGAVVRQNPDLWRRAHAAGHELGNHTFTHRPLPQLTNREILADIDQTQAAVQDATGSDRPMQLLRPPSMLGFTTWGGDRRIRQVVAERQLRITLWDSASNAVVMPRREDPAAVLAEVVRDARRGSIVLLHFIRDDIHALPLILMYLRRHYRLVTISQLFENVYEYIVEEALNEGVI